MKAERPEETHAARQRKKPRASGAKPRRTAEHGPLGFGSVMHDVAGAGKHRPGASAQPNAPQDLGASAMAMLGMVPTTEQLVQAAASGTLDPALQARLDGPSSTSVQHQQPALPTHLGRMTPALLLDKVVSEATKQAIEQASKELHVELEPAHLGPLVVSLRRESDGRLDIRFRARQADAARVLDAGTDLLRERLADAGFSASTIAVEQDADLMLSS